MLFRSYLTRREFGKIPGSLMLIRCLSCETGATFVSTATLNLKTARMLRMVRREASPETLLIGLITRRSQVQVLSPQPAQKFSPPFRFRLCRKLHCGGNFFAFAPDSLRWTRGRAGRERRRQLVRKIDFNRLLYKSADFVGNRRFFYQKTLVCFCNAYH